MVKKETVRLLKTWVIKVNLPTKEKSNEKGIDIDKCKLTDEEREHGIHVSELIKED